MQRTILMVLSTMLMSGCATTDAPLECTGPDAPQVTIRYGDSQLSVNPTRAVVKRNGNFVFHLVPVNLPATDPPNVNYIDVEPIAPELQAKLDSKKKLFSESNHD